MYIDIDYKQKYIKYKQKYLELKTQYGGTYTFKVYLFSENPVTTNEKESILKLLNDLYNNSVVINDTNKEVDKFFLESIKMFVHAKSSEYQKKNNIITYDINYTPANFVGEITDDILTFHEKNIEKNFEKDMTDIKLVDAQHGLYNPTTVLIAIHKSK